MSSRRKKGHGGGHENHERWLITYSDLITLLMIFFVIMYAMSSVDQSKFDSLSVSLNKALKASNEIQMSNMGTSGIVSKRPETNQKPTDPQQQKSTAQQAAEQKQLDDLKKQVEKYVQQNNLAGMVNVLENAKGIQITLSDAALFDSGKAELKPDAQKILGGLSPFLKVLPNEIAVEGHTDNVPITSGKFPSNWELSAQRAINVLHFFEGAEVAHERLHAVGYADTVPLSPNDSDVHRSENRRVNLIIKRQFPMEPISPLAP
ncbi:flagellar motor protein MotB [Tumebacillus permanentifrigoris]|uniref:Chemotaxis protein MotB n=1 Tax=Tumebacillus permanentifrigoris TaxID=378543 RepID=A0A316DUY4_9BACL|nr:flagellar motor protein MotB [Tumebacillus permanentifrigoris]PWK12992.1 chemotaxis protein MotB [Tumebacillus permanentifrigoris]